MNKLINRISPETSENRILHAGFSIILMSEEITQIWFIQRYDYFYLKRIHNYIFH
jgi:hypothetical protein